MLHADHYSEDNLHIKPKFVRNGCTSTKPFKDPILFSINFQDTA